MFSEISFGELVLIMLAVLLVFGSKEIPAIARGLGGGLREFRKAVRGISDEIQRSEQPSDRRSPDTMRRDPNPTRTDSHPGEPDA